MAIAVYFHPKGMTLAQFEETHGRLGAGVARPGGQIHHSWFGKDGRPVAHGVTRSG